MANAVSGNTGFGVRVLCSKPAPALAQIFRQRRRQQSVDRAPSRQARVIRLDRYLALAGQFDKPGRIQTVEAEPDKLHRADALVRHLAIIESCRDSLRPDLQPQMALQSDQPDQRCFALAWLGILDQQAGSRLVRPRLESTRCNCRSRAGSR